MEIADVMRLGATQYGCITTQQGLDVMTKDQWKYLARQRIIRRVWPGVYLVNGFPSTWEQRAMAAVLSIPGAALSHRSAARLLGLTFVASGRVHLTAPGDKCPLRRGVTVHRSSQLAPYVIERGGIRTTNTARTLIDLTSCVSERQLPKIVDQACNLKLVTHGEIEHCLDRMTTVGRSRITKLREVLAVRTTTDEKLDTFLERRTLQWCREWGLPEPSGQVSVVANGSHYRIDLAFEEAKVAIEPDGPHHLLSSVAAYDRQRDADLALDGWMVFHVYKEMGPEDFIPRVRTALAQRAMQRQGE